MFDDFLENEETYLALEQFWTTLFCSMLNNRNDNLDKWIIPYYNTYFRNGQKDMDGNPIFSAKSKQIGRIIRIIQTADDEDIFDYWREDRKYEIVIVLTSCKENIDKAKSVINDWLNE